MICKQTSTLVNKDGDPVSGLPDVHTPSTQAPPHPARQSACVMQIWKERHARNYSSRKLQEGRTEQPTTNQF